ncbi:MAG: hypothetical protein F4Y07_01265 [Gemmatimonadetes bacterium]|nr:hypothetical protein [Gemmatimonadota bacterium]
MSANPTRRNCSVVSALLLMVGLTIGAPVVVTQEPPDDGPTLCELLRATQRQACADALEAIADAESEQERERARKLVNLCLDLMEDYIELCILDPD